MYSTIDITKKVHYTAPDYRDNSCPQPPDTHTHTSYKPQRSPPSTYYPLINNSRAWPCTGRWLGGTFLEHIWYIWCWTHIKDSWPGISSMNRCLSSTRPRIVYIECSHHHSWDSCSWHIWYKLMKTVHSTRRISHSFAHRPGTLYSEDFGTPRTSYLHTCTHPDTLNTDM